MQALTKHNNFLQTIWISLCSVLLISCAAKPPRETGNFKKSDLVELTKLDPTIRLDIRYATSKNLVGRPVYTEARAFLQRPAAEALAQVNKELELVGYQLLVFDGYRPWSVTKLFWNITAKENRKFVANPKKGSRHNRGCAVDLSLWEIASGKEVLMTGEYDEMSPAPTPPTRAVRPNNEPRGICSEAKWNSTASPCTPRNGGTSTIRTGRPTVSKTFHSTSCSRLHQEITR